jgi:hypothetical protein
MGQEFLSVMDALVRLMTPMRREFNLSLDAARFIADQDYAIGMLKTAASSQQPNVQDIVTYLKAEVNKQVVLSKSLEAGKQVEKQTTENVEDNDLEAQARAKMMEKYRAKLR